MRIRTTHLTALASAAFLVAACLPTPATAEAREVERVWFIFLAAAAVVAVVVIGLATWAIVRYRARDDSLPPQIRGDLRLEVIWTALPAITIVGLFAVTLAALDRTESTAAQPGAEIEVTAFRWGWTFAYPAEDVVVTGIGQPGPEIVVPVGEPVRFTLTSNDVIHAFFIPEFLRKTDVNPGRTNVFQVTIEKPGVFDGRCAEFCGIYHARMPFTVRAVERAEYDAWLDEQRAPQAATSSEEP